MRFFEARDKMNAEVHCAEIRWSPITVEVRIAHGLASKLYEQAKKSLEMARRLT